jgi:hypothetical protein
VLPAERRYVLKQGRVQRVVLCQKTGSPFEIDRVPERDCCDNQVQAASSMALVFEGAIADFAESVETDGPSHGIVCFALVEAQQSHGVSVWDL